MTIQTIPRIQEGLAVVDISGSLTARATVEEGVVCASVAKLVEAGCRDVVVHLGSVTDLDAHGVGQLALAGRAALEGGARLAVVAPSARVRRMLEVTRLDTVFDVCATDAELQAGFGARELFGSFGGRAATIACGFPARP